MAAVDLCLLGGIIGLIAQAALFNFDFQKMTLFALWLVAVTLKNLSIAQGL